MADRQGVPFEIGQIRRGDIDDVGTKDKLYQVLYPHDAAMGTWRVRMLEDDRRYKAGYNWWTHEQYASVLVKDSPAREAEKEEQAFLLMAASLLVRKESLAGR
jgi:hypothetical protein